MDSKTTVLSTCTWFTWQKMDMRFIIALLSILLYFLSFLINKSVSYYQKLTHMKEEFAWYITIPYAQPLTTCSNAVGNVSFVESLDRTWKTFHNLDHNVRYVRDLIRTWHAWRERTDVRGTPGPNAVSLWASRTQQYPSTQGPTRISWQTVRKRS